MILKQNWTTTPIFQIKQVYADVMELVDMQDLGSCAARRGGSSPFIRTI